MNSVPGRQKVSEKPSPTDVAEQDREAYCNISYEGMVQLQKVLPSRRLLE